MDRQQRLSALSLQGLWESARVWFVSVALMEYLAWHTEIIRVLPLSFMSNSPNFPDFYPPGNGTIPGNRH